MTQTIKEKKVGTLCLNYGKNPPLSPEAMLIRVILSEAMVGPPTLIDGGWGRI